MKASAHQISPSMTTHHTSPVWVGVEIGVLWFAANGCGIEQDLHMYS
jgi:hypothetical protein